MELEDRMFKVYAKGDEKIQLKIIPGHFVTSQVCRGCQDRKASFRQI